MRDAGLEKASNTHLLPVGMSGSHDSTCLLHQQHLLFQSLFIISHKSLPSPPGTPLSPPRYLSHRRHARLPGTPLSPPRRLPCRCSRPKSRISFRREARRWAPGRWDSLVAAVGCTGLVDRRLERSVAGHRGRSRNHLLSIFSVKHKGFPLMQERGVVSYPWRVQSMHHRRPLQPDHQQLHTWDSSLSLSSRHSVLHVLGDTCPGSVHVGVGTCPGSVHAVVGTCHNRLTAAAGTCCGFLHAAEGTRCDSRKSEM